jgi:hypothetical protein
LIQDHGGERKGTPSQNKEIKRGFVSVMLYFISQTQIYLKMVSPWWGLGVAVPAMAIRAFSGKGKGQNREDEPLSR